MKSRFVISLLCVGAVAFACGPRARNDASSSGAGSTTLAATRSVAQQGKARMAPDAKSTSPISAALVVQRQATTIHFALQVVNSGRRSIELTFPSGQTHEFVVLDSAGKEVWRWGTGRLFTQALQNKLLARGESLDMRESWTAPTLKPGRYTVVATLKSENYPVTETTELTVGEATLAVRE